MNQDDKKQRHREEEDQLKIYGAPGSTLQTPEEHRHDQQVDPRRDSSIDVSNDDLRETSIDKMHEDLDGKRGDVPEIDDRLGLDRNE